MVSKGILEQLSPLEAEVFKAMTPGNKFRVRAVHSAVAKKQKVLLTSVAVMLDRLHEKGLVGRDTETCRGGTRYIYFLKKAHGQIEEDYIKQQVDRMISKFGDSAVSYFHKRFAEGKK